MSNIELNSPIVSVQWLHQNINASNIVILDASIKKVTGDVVENESGQIPQALFFDIKNAFSDVSAPFPNTVPSVDQFTKEAQHLGINKDSVIVVYDDKGIYSSARAWYLFKAFGCNNVAVLDGGLPEWEQSGLAVEVKGDTEQAAGDFEGTYNPKYFKFFSDIKRMSTDSNCLILDARSSQRFEGLIDEPRKGLRSGHIPNSVNLPFANLLEGNCLKTQAELKAIFKELSISDRTLVFSCGSGITACIIALAAEISGYTNLCVYDGSWTEYGSLT